MLGEGVMDVPQGHNGVERTKRSTRRRRGGRRWQQRHAEARPSLPASSVEDNSEDSQEPLQELLQEPLRDGRNPREVAYAVALRALARREHSVKELRQKLRHRGIAEAVADETLSRLREECLQSDERFTEIFVRSRIERGQGELRIRAELRNKGIDEEMATRYFRRDEGDWNERAADVLSRKFDRTARALFERFHSESSASDDDSGPFEEESNDCGVSFYDERRRLNARMGRFLASRGFTAGIARSAIDELWRDIEST